MSNPVSIIQEALDNDLPIVPSSWLTHDDDPYYYERDEY